MFKKLINRIKNYFKRRTVYIHDKFYDYMIDNDDLYDSITIVKVTYSGFRGIIDVTFTERIRESDLCDIAKFYSICDIDEFGGLTAYKKYSIYDRLKRPNKYDE